MILDFQSLKSALKFHRNLLLAGALFGVAAAACDAKTIGDESSGKLTCEDGDSKDAGDGCNTCACEGGEWYCTRLTCGDCVDGEVKPADDGCNTCSCSDGNWACTLIACEETGGPMAACGNGIVEYGEQCDDGNDVNGDGCEANCQLGDGIDSTTGTTGDPDMTGGATDISSTGPGPVCGNGLVEFGEQCDDGNNVDGDGCSVSCVAEGGGPLSCVEPVADDPFEFLHAGIVGDVLVAEVQYSGGCEEHLFAYCWDGFSESDPVQTWAKISHDGNDDPCEALPVEVQEFDLSDMKQAYQDAYQTQNGEITIHLDGWGQSLAYVF